MKSGEKITKLILNKILVTQLDTDQIGKVIAGGEYIIPTESHPQCPFYTLP